MSGLVKRIISAAVLLPIMIFFIMKGGYYFKAFLMILAFLMAFEYERLTKLPRKSRSIFTATIFAIVFWVLSTSTAKAMLDGAMVIAIVGFLVFQLGIILNKLQLKWAGVGMAYIGVPVFSLGYMEIATQGPWWVFWLMLVVWGCDTGAYAFGKLIGGPKLAPRISPNKTWAGAIGGFFMGALAGGVAGHFFGIGEAFFLAMMGGLLAIWGQIGDLVESFIKRSFKAKDSGFLIPGHGGVLDRVDALVFTAPFVAISLWLAG